MFRCILVLLTIAAVLGCPFACMGGLAQSAKETAAKPHRCCGLCCSQDTPQQPTPPADPPAKNDPQKKCAGGCFWSGAVAPTELVPLDCCLLSYCPSGPAIVQIDEPALAPGWAKATVPKWSAGRLRRLSISSLLL